jgi:hypothetical protein
MSFPLRTTGKPCPQELLFRSCRSPIPVRRAAQALPKKASTSRMQACHTCTSRVSVVAPVTRPRQPRPGRSGLRQKERWERTGEQTNDRIKTAPPSPEGTEWGCRPDETRNTLRYRRVSTETSLLAMHSWRRARLMVVLKRTLALICHEVASWQLPSRRQGVGLGCGKVDFRAGGWICEAGEEEHWWERSHSLADETDHTAQWKGL